MNQRYAELRSHRPFYTTRNRVFRGANIGRGDGSNVRAFWYGRGLSFGSGCGNGSGYAPNVGYGNGNGNGNGNGYGDGYRYLYGDGSGCGRGYYPIHELRGVV